MDLSQTWLAQVGKGAARDGMMVLGFVALAIGGIALATSTMAPFASTPLRFIAQVFGVLGGLFLALPLFLASMSEERWSNGVRIAGMVVGFLILAITLVRV